MSPRPFPGHSVRAGEKNATLVREIQRALAGRGCGPLALSGSFDAATAAAVRLFQARFTDVHGLPLKVDGIVGPVTWAALFPDAAPPPVPAPSPLAAAALDAARGEVGVREVPPGSNRGPEVDAYLRTVGLEPAGGSYAWCAAFVYWCYDRGAAALGVPNPLPRTAGVLALWNGAGRAGAERIAAAEVSVRPSLVRSGQIFVLSTGGGLGHVGLVESVDGGVLTTIEGNTNDGGSREGIGVFRRSGPNGRKIASINRGFVQLPD
jgi:peptidoglycan hydrolase-like protein with peptidoglycan-binding domain